MKKILQSQETVEYQDDARDFIKFLDKEEGKARSGKRHKQKKSFAPSGVAYGSGRCPRYWYYAFTGAEYDDKYSALDVRNMAAGTDAHERFQNLLKDLGIADDDIEREINYDDPPIYGFIDAIVEWNGRKWVVEFKTSKTKWFSYRRQQLKPPTYHLVQILIYMFVTGIRQGMIVYEDKDTGERTAIAVEWSTRYSEYIEKIMSCMKEVYSTVTSGKLPERGFSKSSNECKGCPVKAICWKDDREADLKLKNLPTIKL